LFPPGNTLDPPPQSGRQRCSGDTWIEKQEAAIARKPTPAKESPKRRVAAEPKPKAATKAKASAKPKAEAEPKAKAAPKIAATKAAAAKPAVKPAAKASKAALKIAATKPAPKRAAAKAAVAKPAPKPAAKASKAVPKTAAAAPAPKPAAAKAAAAKPAPKPAAKASKAVPKAAAAAPAPKRAAAKAAPAKPAPKPATKASKAAPKTKAEPKAKPATKVTAPRPARGRRREKIAPDRLEILVEAARQSLEDDKAENIVILDVTGRADYTDRLIIATGQVERQLQAMATHLDEALGKAGLHIKRDAIQASGDWVLIDAGDLVIHLFRPDARELYRLERMWGPESPLTTEASDAAPD
jgi:ribosome silencing factor RsfS/YbeB/iojap